MTETLPTEFAGQARALASLIALADQHPDLPTGYLTCHADAKPIVLLDHPSDFEAWRSALLVDPQAVVMGSLSGNAKLSFHTSVHGVPLHVWTSFPLAAPEGATA